METRRGKFITFEGVEGTGKTTQCALLCDYLRGHDVDVLETREPGGTPLGENARRLLLEPGDDAPSARAELLLFLAARAQLTANVIAPALEAGRWVLCDRFSDATIAYQGYGRGLDIEAIKKLDEFATAGLKPDRTILLDLDVETGITRALTGEKEFDDDARGDRMENEDMKFHARVRDGYLALAEGEPERIQTIPVSGSIMDIHKSVASLIEPLVLARTK